MNSILLICREYANTKYGPVLYILRRKYLTLHCLGCSVSMLIWLFGRLSNIHRSLDLYANAYQYDRV